MRRMLWMPLLLLLLFVWTAVCDGLMVQILGRAVVGLNGFRPEVW